MLQVKIDSLFFQRSNLKIVGNRQITLHSWKERPSKIFLPHFLSMQTVTSFLLVIINFACEQCHAETIHVFRGFFASYFVKFDRLEFQYFSFQCRRAIHLTLHDSGVNRNLTVSQNILPVEKFYSLFLSLEFSSLQVYKKWPVSSYFRLYSQTNLPILG